MKLLTSVINTGLTKSANLIERPQFTLKVMIFTAVLCLPALFCDIFADDYWHYATLNHSLPLEHTEDASLFNLFSFANGDPAYTKSMTEIGMTPWRIYDGYKIMFWRPLTELTHWLDYTFWPQRGGFMHLQNIMWYLFLIAGLSLLYRSTMNSRLTIGIALLAYAIDSAHGSNVAWIAGRNGIIATFFGIMALVAHIRYREKNLRVYAFLSPLFLTLAMLAGEYGIATGGYLFAYAACMDKRGPIKGFLALIPYAVVVLMWASVYKWYDYGAISINGYYIDPLTNPLNYLVALAFRLPTMFGSQWGFVPADFVPHWNTKAFAINVTILTLFMAAIFPILKRERVARFWLLGMVLSALPVAAAPPSARLFLFVSIGGCGLLGLFLKECFSAINTTKARNDYYRFFTKFVAAVMILCHFIIEPIAMPLSIYVTQIASESVQKHAASIPELYDMTDKRVVLVNSPTWLNFSLASIWAYNSVTLPKSMWLLTSHESTSDDNETTFEVLSDHAISADLKNGFIEGFEHTFRDLELHPFKPGDVIDLSGLDIEIVSITEENHPKKVIFHFEQTIYDEEFIFVEWTKKGFQPFNLPELGQTVTLKALDVVSST